MNAFAFVLLSILYLVNGQQNCEGTPNTQPIGTDDPKFVANGTNGRLFVVGNVVPQINLLHVYGTPYQMGYAQGELLKDQVNALITEALEWAEEQADQYLDEFPEDVRKLIEKYGLEMVLEMTYWATKDYIPARFLEELQGMSDASGMEYMQLVRMHMFPELIKAQCSMFGAWGPAIANTQGTLYQLRALDWSTNGPFQKYPTVVVYHPQEGHNFSIVTWAGFIGGLTGYSSAPVGLSQKVWISYNGTDSRIGIPFHFLLRDILQFDVDITSALNRIYNAARTCSVWIGLGDQTHTFRGKPIALPALTFKKAIQYSYETVRVYDDINFQEYDGHPTFKGLVYIDKHVQPSHNPCMGSLMTKYYGGIDAITTIKYITSLAQTGDTHIAVYDFASQYMYVSNASPYVNNTFTPAYDRPFTRFSMGTLFAESL